MTIVSSFAYQNDALGRRTERRDALAGVAAVATNLFAYNARSEVESAQMRQDTYSFGYDEIGNRLWASDPWVCVDYTPNELNQYEDFGEGEWWRSPISHDTDGNMASTGDWQYEWDAENRLAAVWWEYEEEWEGWYWYEMARVEYQYDHLSRRVGKTVLSRYGDPEAPWTTNTVTKYVFDGWNLVAERIHSPEIPNTHTNHYVWGLDISGTLQGAGGVGGLVAAFLAEPAALFPCYDGNGNVTDLVDADGVRQARYEYTPFGDRVDMSGSKAWYFPFRFSTKYNDGDTAMDLYYYGYRWYNPYHGRWLSRDPIGEKGGLNVYGFVGNDGVNGVDPLGEKRIDGALIGWAKSEGLNDNCCGELKKHYQAYHGELTCCLYECGRGAGAFSTLVSVGGILVGAAGRAGWLGQGAVAKVTADVLLGLGAAALAWDTGYRWGCERLCRKDVCSRVDTPHAFLKEERSRFWRPSRIVLEYWCKPPRDLRPSGQRE